ncbi:MAG: hypothetical protein IRZ16_06975 [Myxococcaceae bacterium]|nr:hypothetical protein [Myxococcaceae bacterium]
MPGVKTPWIAIAALGCALVLGCGRTSLTPERPCQHTLCPPPYVCDPEDGACKVPQPDGTDAGRDAGADAGLDGGVVDAGQDGGQVPCANGCPPERFCDPAANGGAGECVLCTRTIGCAAPTPVCDTSVSGGRCVGCLDDLDCDSPTPACDVMTHTCVACTSDVQCGGLLPFCDRRRHVCAQCLFNQDCPAQAPICDASGTCRGCTTNADCENPTPVCEVSSQQCAACTADLQCGAGEVCLGGLCGPLPDTCATAFPLSFPAGSNTLHFRADTSSAGDDEVGSCNPVGGPELVYRLTLTGPFNLSVTATRASGSVNPVIYLRRGSCSGTQIACSNTSAITEMLTATNLSAGDYYLFIESRGNVGGTIDVTVKTVPLGPSPSNDNCAGAQPLTLINGAATVLGTTATATNSNGPNAVTPSCSPSARLTGSDVVYELTLTQPRDVLLRVTPTGSNPSLRPAMYVRGPSTVASCSSDTELGCVSAGSGPPSPQTLMLPNLGAGMYYVWIDGVDDTTGSFQLDVQTSSPTSNDSCVAPEPLLFVNGVAMATGDTRFANNDNSAGDTSPTCSVSAKASGQDVVFRYLLLAQSDVIVTVTPTGSPPTLVPVIYVRGPQCGVTTSANELICQSAVGPTPQTLTLFNQPPGTYYLWIDGAQQTAGTFSLTVATSGPTLPPSNDTCNAPTVLTLGVATVGDTTTATDTFARSSVPGYAFACTTNNNLPFTGRDLVYQFTATSTQHTITVTPMTSFDPAVLLLPQLCSPTACTAFVDAQGKGGTETLVANTVPGQVYFVVVDAFIAQEFGAFSIQVQ